MPAPIRIRSGPWASIGPHDPQSEKHSNDPSDPRFSTYLERAEDERMVESRKGDADGILVFVRLFILLDLSSVLAVYCCRLAYPPPPWQPFSETPTRSFSRTLRTHLSSISPASESSLPPKMAPTSLFPQQSLILPPSVHPRPLSRSMLCGSSVLS
ncbi:hypothetical protein BC834DRAFT_206005 [Gloeopeniophorella convolvens]|nr:hypothetical protein BC834DRAFT_206005 [Gloeopeniophorella convolvens]